ncbi:MAG: hypothetical protein JW834_02670 [Candidatus Diapherotrites archaeon]|nr:hypothetical protein [Candidatus Diapherotrites archaeon]
MGIIGQHEAHLGRIKEIVRALENAGANKSLVNEAHRFLSTEKSNASTILKLDLLERKWEGVGNDWERDPR